MNKHELKTWPDYFKAVQNGLKTFEVRKNDRSFKVGDLLELCEWSPSMGYTGRSLLRHVVYVAYLGDIDDALIGYVAMAVTT